MLYNTAKRKTNFDDNVNSKKITYIHNEQYQQISNVIPNRQKTAFQNSTSFDTTITIFPESMAHYSGSAASKKKYFSDAFLQQREK